MGFALHDSLLTGCILINDIELTATAAALNRAGDPGQRMINAGAALSVTVADHDGGVIAFNQSTGTAITLPVATGSGAWFRFLVMTVPTGNNDHTIEVAPDTDDQFIGQISAMAANASATAVNTVGFSYALNDNFDTITLDNDRNGGKLGDFISLIDMAPRLWAISGQVKIDGTARSPLANGSITAP